MSMVNIAELELKMDVSEDMRAASMTARRSPLSPSGNVSFTSMMKAMLVQPDLKKINNLQGASHGCGKAFVDLK